MTQKTPMTADEKKGKGNPPAAEAEGRSEKAEASVG